MKYLIAAAMAVSLRQPTDNQMLLMKYVCDLDSDCVANGDSRDAMEDFNSEDQHDDIVDYSGSTNRGYGSERPVDFFAKNNINLDNQPHFGTVPRAELDDSPAYVPYTNEELHVDAYDNYEPTDPPYTRYWKKFGNYGDGPI